jgi:hypothetical protein
MASLASLPGGADLSDLEIVEPDDDAERDAMLAPDSLGIPEEWSPFVQNGLTMVRFTGPTSSLDVPFHVDFVWDQNIRFTYYGADGVHRAMYILRPVNAFASALSGASTASWAPLIAGVVMKKPKLRVLKMAVVTFVEE